MRRGRGMWRRGVVCGIWCREGFCFVLFFEVTVNYYVGGWELIV